jgi:hypothetical protein
MTLPPLPRDPCPENNAPHSSKRDEASIKDVSPSGLERLD